MTVSGPPLKGWTRPTAGFGWATLRDESHAEGWNEGHEEGHAEGLAEGRAEGLAEGRAEGEARTRRENALKMRADNMTVELIAKYTGLTAEEIAAL